MARFNPFLIVVDVAQHPQIIVQAHEYRVQRPGLSRGGLQPGLGALAVPRLGTPLAGCLVRGVGVLGDDFFAFAGAVHGIGVSLDVGLGGGFHHRFTQRPGVIAPGFLIGLHRLGVGVGDEFSHHLGGVFKGRAMVGLQLVGHGAQGHMAHVRTAFGGVVAEQGAVLRVEWEFGVKHPGVVVLVQRQPRQRAVGYVGSLGLQRLWLEPASGRHGITLERAFFLPQVQKADPQTPRGHGVALSGHAGGATGMSGLFLRQGVPHGHHEHFRLVSRAWRQGAFDVDVRLRLGGAFGLRGVIDHGQFLSAHAQGS